MSGQNANLPADYCHFELEDDSYRIGIIGTGPGFRAILDIIFTEEYRDFLPPLTLVAVAEPGSEREKLAHPRMRAIPVYETLADMLAAHPDINLLIELVGKRFKIRQILASLPDGVSLIDHTASFFLSALNNIAKISQHVRLDLSHQRALFEAIIDEVNEDVMLLDRKGNVVDVSRNVAERRGLTKAECLGQPCTKVQSIAGNIPFCHPGRDDCPFYAALRTRDRAEAMESRVGPDGRLLYYRVYAYPIFNQLDELTHVMVMRRDITERTLGEKKAQQTEKFDVIAKMSTYLAHEIRNPLFAISGFARALLRSQTLEAKDREKVEVIAEESVRLDNILKNLLDFARPAAQGSGESDVNAVVSEIAGEMEFGLPDRRFVIETRLAGDIPRAACEAALLKQCLINLIKNSIAAMPEGGSITLSTGMDRHFVRLSVADTGVGMSPETMEKVFNPFFSTRKGYGFGLPLIKKTIEDCGGKVDVISLPGQGATATLLIPPVLASARKA